MGLVCLFGISADPGARAQDNRGRAAALRGIKADEPTVLQSDRLGLVFDRKAGTIKAIQNKLTAETYLVEGDEFDVEALQFRVGLADTKLVDLAVERNTLKAVYDSSDLTIEVLYTLRDHFVEKQMTPYCPSRLWSEKN